MVEIFKVMTQMDCKRVVLSLLLGLMMNYQDDVLSLGHAEK